MTDTLMRALISTHEAAHAVTTLRLGLSLQSVTLEGDGGYVSVLDAPSRWRETLVVLSAGDVAVKRAGGTYCSAQDERDAWAIINRRGFSALEAATVLGDAKRQAEQLVTDHWDTVERVAAALFRTGRLGATDVRRLCEPGATADSEVMFLMRLAVPAARR
ncbi:MAG: hypothetical protein U0Z70_06995 [Thermomicrobiales bacterium]